MIAFSGLDLDAALNCTYRRAECFTIGGADFILKEPN